MGFLWYLQLVVSNKESGVGWYEQGCWSDLAEHFASLPAGTSAGTRSVTGECMDKSRRMELKRPVGGHQPTADPCRA